MGGRFTPMARGAGQGLSRLASALGGGDNTEQKAFDASMMGQSKIGLMLAQMRGQEANAAKDYAAADETRVKTDALASRPQMVQRLVAGASGVDVPNLGAFLQKLDTGSAGQVPMGPEAPDGGMGVGTAQFDPATASRITQALQRFSPMATNTGDIKADDWAKALGQFRNMDLGDSVLSGQRTPGAVGASQAAVEGKPLFNSDANGAVLDLFGGKLATDNPMAQGTIALKGAQAGAQKANAAQSYAAAGNSNASAAKTRAEMEQGAKGTYDPTRGVIIDPRGGTARPVIDQETGKPLGAAARTGPMSVTLQKELLESDDSVQAARNVVTALERARGINDKAYSGFAASTRAKVVSNVMPGGTESADATVDLENLMTGQALESLKSTFGAAPTEGERKILMDMQASADKTPKQRQEIIDRAINAAKRRAIYATNKAKAIRDGSYLSTGAASTGVPDASPEAGGFKYLGKE